MNLTNGISHERILAASLPREMICQKPLMVALAVISAIGLLIASLSVAGYLPSIAFWAGLGAFVPSIIAFTALNCTSKATPTSSLKSLDDKWRDYLNDQHLAKGGTVNHAQMIDKHVLKNGDWINLPSEKLLNEVIDHWLSNNVDIFKRVCPEFLRECAIAYSAFRNKILEDDRLWNCINIYQDYLADIAKRHGDFGVQMMTSIRGESITDDKYRLEIFNASYETFLEDIENDRLDDQKVQHFVNFIIKYRLVADDEFFKKIQRIGLNLKIKRDNSPEATQHKYSLYASALDLIEGKLFFQGIYKTKERETFFPSPDNISEWIPEVFSFEWLEKTEQDLSLSNKEEEIYKGAYFLSLIPDSSTHYIDAQFALGNVWFDLENFSEASSCFLRVLGSKTIDHDSQCFKDALMLALASTFAKVKQNDQWRLIERGDFDLYKKHNNQETELLTWDECKTYNLESFKNARNELLRIKYGSTFT